MTVSTFQTRPVVSQVTSTVVMPKPLQAMPSGTNTALTTVTPPLAASGVTHAVSPQPTPLINPHGKNPFTDTLARYTGYFNEMTAAANTLLQDTINQVTRYNPRYHGVADTLDALADQVVLAYCGMDAGYAGAKAYYATKERLADTKTPHKQEVATARGIQAATKQFVFQFFASFYLPALVIRKLIRPTGEALGGKALANVLHQAPAHAAKVLPRMTLEVAKPLTEEAFAQLKAQGLKGQLFKPLRQVIHPGEVAQIVGYQTRFTQFSQEALHHAKTLLQQPKVLPRSSMAGFIAGVASIPLLVKLIDPIVHHATHWLIEKPSNAFITKRWGDTLPADTTTHHG
ncbi:MAG: hypothetical protein ACKO37_04020 [Vampirovibrionales bacterium]